MFKWSAHKFRVGGAAGIALLAGAGVVAYLIVGPSAEVSTYKVGRGEFQVTLFETGETQAARGEKISTPRVDADLKIVYLWPEGERVDVGDLILKFEPAEFEQQLRNAADELEKAKADLDKATVQFAQRLADRKTQITLKEADLELARIRLRKAQLLSPVELEEAQIGLQQSERALTQAQGDLKAQEIVNRVEMGNFQIRLQQQQDNYDRAKRNYDLLSVYAPAPGIVIYEKIRKAGQFEKVKVGDQVWGNMTLLSLPDLSHMQVLSQVGETDVKKVQVDQRAFIRLDAFPGLMFHGKVAKVAPMANPSDDAPNVQVFEMLVDIDEQEEHLKPGMSAAVEVVLEAIPGVLSVPLNTVFEHNGKAVVYCLRGRKFSPVQVQLGKRNATSAIVESGLEEGALVALEEPGSP